MSAEHLAARGVAALERALVQSPPPHVSVAFVQRFFAKTGPALRDALLRMLQGLQAARVQQPESVLPIEGMPPDEWPQAARMAANVAAIRLLASGQTIGPEERRVLLRYSGLGGLSREALIPQVPQGFVPEARGLIHEYYTPTRVADEIARVLRPFVQALPRQDGVLRVLEPAAGIGRLIHALTGPGYEDVALTTVEDSGIAAKMLAAVRPDITVYAGPFERWVTENEATVQGKLGLVVSNPPYGQRGASTTEDGRRAYRETKAYVYFLRRGLDLLAASGIGVFLVPYGFLTGQTAALAQTRTRVLKRHHLMGAYRLPSKLFPGANLVTDLLFFRARGGELAEVLPDDGMIVRGEYFQQTPTHILGVERGKHAEEDDTTRKPRWGYEVEGSFTRLPDLVERPMCMHCSVTPFYTEPTRARRMPTSVDALPEGLLAAQVLGQRVGHFLTTLARGDEASLRTAKDLFGELREALLAWVQARRAEGVLGESEWPHTDRVLVQAAQTHADLLTFLSAFGTTGELIDALQTVPVYVPRYQGVAEDIGAQAAFLYGTRRHLTLDALAQFRKDEGITTDAPLHTALIAAGWCFDDGAWLPARDYYTGWLWPRYERARHLAQDGDGQAAAQAAKLLAAMKPVRLTEILPTPRMPWVPETVLQAWLAHWTEAAVPRLWRNQGLLMLHDTSYAQTDRVAEHKLATAIGYLNHDAALFQVQATKQRDAETGEEESAEAALDRARTAYAEAAQRSFTDFVTQRPVLTAQIEETYNRLYRSYVPPEYAADELPIARWRGRIALKSHQRAGALRLIQNNGGLLGFDVGVGKTFTGIAALAALRQAGRARRPVVVVPNTIIWKWAKDVQRVLPDYRVLVVGAERYVGRSGGYMSRIDTPAERALKWRQFQAGQHDVALVTYSVFGRNSIRAERVRQWIEKTPALQRELGLKARTMLKGIKSDEPSQRRAKQRRGKARARAREQAAEGTGAEAMTEGDRVALEQRALERERVRDEENARIFRIVEGITDLSEREQAVLGEAVERWIAERTEHREEADPGIYWEDLQCDFLMLDEAQNMKNLWAVQPREGGVPKYLGAIQEGSDRAWAFALRAALVQEQTGGAGVTLLSATPAKNSPLEYFTLLGFVDGQSWTRLGITNPEVFIDRYLQLQIKEVVGTDLSVTRRSVVAGFRHLDELRGVVFRYAEFRTAEEVGLTLPQTQVEQIAVPMSEAQNEKYEEYLAQYRDALRGSQHSPRLRYQALGLLQRMSLVAIHPALDAGPLNKKGKPEWTWGNASQVTSPSCPKLDRICALIMQKPECGHLVFCDNVAVHAWLRMLLLAAGFAVERLAIFNADQAPTPLARQALAEGFNGVAPVLDEKGRVEQEGIAPLYDVVIANATAYEGIDLHVRTCQVYHVDLPWEPATLQQRNGRAVRQGNLQAVIKIFYLLSERSMDAARLGMILGKLNWMKDILKSAERATNNPAAQAEMNPEELLLYLARDPEEAKAAIAKQKQQLAEEAKSRVRTLAWTTLRGLVNRVQAHRRTKDDMQRAELSREIEEQRSYLENVPAEIWPWYFLVLAALRGTQMLFCEGALWRGAVQEESALYRVSEGSGMEIGKLRGNTIGVRLFGEAHFQPVTMEDLEKPVPDGALHQIQQLVQKSEPVDVENALAAWPKEQDHELLKPVLAAKIASLALGSLDVLDLAWASAAWRTWLWAEHGADIVEALRRAPTTVSLRIPVVRRSMPPVLELLIGQALRGREKDVLPFVAESWDELLKLAAGSAHRYTALNAMTLAWWGRGFPRGMRTAQPALGTVHIALPGEQTKEVPVLWRAAHFAITEAVDGVEPAAGDAQRTEEEEREPRYAITHLASGKAVARDYTTVERAVLAAEWLANKPIDWSVPDPAGLHENLAMMLRWIRSQTTEPTRAEIDEAEYNITRLPIGQRRITRKEQATETRGNR